MNTMQQTSPTEQMVQSWLNENKNLSISEMIDKIPSTRLLECRDYFLKIEQGMTAQLKHLSEIIELLETRAANIIDQLS